MDKKENNQTRTKEDVMDLSKDELLKEANSRKKSAQGLKEPTQKGEAAKKTTAAKKSPTAKPKTSETSKTAAKPKAATTSKPGVQKAAAPKKPADEPMSMDDKEYLKQVHTKIEQIAKELDEPVKTFIPGKGLTTLEDKQAVVDSLQKLTEKVQAQKRLEREMMEKEAKKTQEKDLSLIAKLNELGVAPEGYENDYTTSEEFEAQKEQVDLLKKQISFAEKELANVNKFVDKLQTLMFNDIPIIDRKRGIINPQLEKELQSKDNDISRLNKEIAFKQTIVESADIAYSNITKSYEELEQVVEKLSEENQKLKANNSKESTKNKELNQVAKDKDKQISEAQRELKALEKKLESNETYVSKTKEVEAVIKQKDKELTELTNQVKAYERKFETKETQLAKAREDLKVKLQELTNEHRVVIREKDKLIRQQDKKIQKFNEDLPKKIQEAEDTLRKEIETKVAVDLAEKQKLIDSMKASHKEDLLNKEKTLKERLKKAHDNAMARKVKTLETDFTTKLGEKDQELAKTKGEFEVKLQQVQSQLAEAKKEYEQKEAEIAQKYLDLADAQQKEIDEIKANAEKDMEEKIKSAVSSSEDVKKLEETLIEKQIMLETTQKTIEELSTSQLEKDVALEQLKETTKKLEDTLSEKQQLLDEQKIAEETKDLELAALKQNAEKTEQDLMEQEAQIISLANTLKESNKEVSEIRELLEQQKKQHEEDHQSIEHFEVEMKEQELVIQDLKEQLAEEKQQSKIVDEEKEKESIEKIAKLEEANERLENEIQKIRDEFERKTIEMAEDYEVSLEDRDEEHEKALLDRENDFALRMDKVTEAYKLDVEKKEAEFTSKMDEIEENYNLILSEREKKYEDKIQELESTLSTYREGQPKPLVVEQKEPEPIAKDNAYLDQLNILKAEIEKMKQEKHSPPVTPVPVAKQEYTPPQYQEPKMDYETMRLIQEVRDEIHRTREDMQRFASRRDYEMKELSSDYEKRLRIKDEEKQNIEDRSYEVSKKMERLSKEIEDREYQISEMEKKHRFVTEDDILDPEFKRKIRTIREMKSELDRRSQEEENMYLNSVKNINTKIDIRKQEIDTLNGRIRNLEKEYYAQRDFTSTAKEDFERAKTRMSVELDLQQSRLHELVEEDSVRAKSRYQSFLKDKDEQMARLAASEIELIDFYLEKRKRELSMREDYSFYKQKEEEKDILQKQLSELKSAQQMAYDVLSENRFEMSRVVESNEELKSTISDDYKLRLTEKIKSQDARLKELNKEYSAHVSKIQELKKKQEERIELEKKLRTNEKAIGEYYQNVSFLQSMAKDYETNKENIANAEVEIAEYGDDPSRRSEILKAKAAIQDIEILQNDLTSKIDYAKGRVKELKANERVAYYIELVANMEKIRSVYQTVKEKAKNAKDEINIITRELESLKAERIKSV